MKLKELIKDTGLSVAKADLETEVMGIAIDSRGVSTNWLFAALPGEHVDGRSFINDAVSRGASCVLASKPADADVAQVIAEDLREALAVISARFYGAPSEKVRLIGVTGTNGKTTTTFLLESILRQAGFNPGVIGTINYRYGGTVFPAPHTTPQAPHLQKILREMADAGVTHCVMEVSSHALEQKRVGSCRFVAGVFTNLTHDHLDYHKTMEEYFRCKKMLFSMVEGSGGVNAVNIDDEWGGRLKNEFPCALSYSLEQGADVYPLEYALLHGATEARIKTPAGEVNISSHLVGEYNLQNILAAVTVASGMGIGVDAIKRGVEILERVPGRLEKIEARGPKSFKAYVDYAHTGDALERAIKALKDVSAARVITVFGCGGNRDRLKRPRMGEISARLSDITIVTSDNPRDEDPLEIIKEIEAGIKDMKKFAPGEDVRGKGYLVIPDRAEAIRKAVELAANGDTILLAGKGHEDYQIVKGEKLHFSDFEALSSAIKEAFGPQSLCGNH